MKERTKTALQRLIDKIQGKRQPDPNKRILDRIRWLQFEQKTISRWEFYREVCRNENSSS
jgi:hypothetical protein